MAFRTRTRLDAGCRDRVITIEQLNEALEGADAADLDSGAPLETWTTLVEMPASRQDVQGYERLRTTRQAAANEVRWEINYRPDMDPELIDVAKLRRIVFQGRVYDIVGASQVGRKRGIELWTVASTAVDEDA